MIYFYGHNVGTVYHLTPYSNHHFHFHFLLTWMTRHKSIITNPSAPIYVLITPPVMQSFITHMTIYVLGWRSSGRTMRRARRWATCSPCTWLRRARPPVQAWVSRSLTGCTARTSQARRAVMRLVDLVREEPLPWKISKKEISLG